MARYMSNKNIKAGASRATSAALALLMLTALTCTQQKKGGSLCNPPRVLITQRTDKGVDSAAAVAGKFRDYMTTVEFISPTQTKGPILTAMNSDNGPKGTSKKPYIRV